MPFFSATRGPIGSDGNQVINSFEFESAVIETGAGDDRITSFFASDDIINSGAGNDRISAGGGDDVINAGSGFNEVLGGSGSDVFVFTEEFFEAGGRNVTVIGDFSSDDLIDLRGLGADASFADLDTNGDGVIGAGDDNVIASDDGSFVQIFVGEPGNESEILIGNGNGLPELTEDLFSFG